MLRLSTLCTLLVIGAAQNGYDYNRPGKPFNPGTTPNRPGNTAGPTNGYPTSPTAASYPSGPQGDEYSGSPAPSGYPSTNQGYPAAGQQPQQAFPGSGPAYQGQGQSTAPGGIAGQPSGGYTGADNNGFSGQTGGLTGQTTGGFKGIGQGQNYPGQTGGQGGTGFGQGPSGFDGSDNGLYEGGDYSAIPGEPDRDYPILSEIPETSFRCDAQPYPGYYADVETRCQVFHVCANNRTFDFLCPNGTIFSQEVFVCVWWNQFDCNSAPSFFELNANLYDYSITGSQSSQGQGYSGGDTGYSQNPSYPSAAGPSPSFPSSQSGTSYPGNTGSQGSYPQGPTSTFPSQQGPTGSFSGNTAPSGSYANTGPQGPTQSYPAPQGSTSFPGTQPSYPSGSQGYPAGRPNGPSFISGANNVRQPSSGQAGSGYPLNTPNREYLPPKN